jgi:alkanesulfonate monooxygenase SsuD/methylene tetrahydromethanopterin reductase-like flavin-dependent oxidoreductase (luciferase family)
MKIGVQLPEVERVVPWPEYAAMARAAEEVGFDSIWVGDHLLYDDPPRGPWEAWTLLGALAAVTERVELGPLVACTAFHPPGVIAKMAATIDEVSGGRFRLGLGAGWNETEFRAFGLPFDRLVDRFAESIDVIKRLLVGSRVGDAVLLPRPERPPRIMLGATGPRMLRIGLPYVSAWNTWYDAYGNRAEGFAALNERVTGVARAQAIPPELILRSACVLVALDGADEREHTAPPLTAADLVSELRALGEAGADEAILVVDPITEASIRSLAPVLDAVR